MAAWPFAARAQQQERMRHIGALLPRPRTIPHRQFAGNGLSDEKAGEKSGPRAVVGWLLRVHKLF
jgi:hypothetical protein